MDPTAQTNNPNPQGDSAKSPIEPGQFVVAGEDPTQVVSQPAPQQPLAASQTPPVQDVSPKPGFSLAQDKNLAQSYPTPPPPPPPTPPPPPIPQQPDQPMQPDPTPFTGPGQTPPYPTSPQPPGSKMKKIKLFVIIIAVLVLIAIVGAVAWFFVLQKPQTPQSAKTQDIQQVIEPTPTPQLPTGGFGQLPQATNGAEASGASQIPTFSPPAAP